MIINNNSSQIFRGRIMGMEPGDGFESENIENNTYDDKQKRLLQAIQPINFNEKIMGGNNSQNFLSGKLPEIGGSLAYTQRVNILTGKGATMEENQNKKIFSSGNADEKIASMLGGQKGAKFDIDKILGSSKKSNFENMLSGHTGKSDKIFKMLGDTSKKSKMFDINTAFGNVSKKSSKKNVIGFGNMNASDKISKMLSGKTKSKSFDIKTGFGSRAFAGLNLNTKINEGFGIGLSNIKNNNKNAKNNAMSKINNSFGMSVNMAKSNVSPNNFNVKQMFGTFGNPEKTAMTRLKQQNGLPMFGDFDGDKVLNMFDCNPLDPMLQGEQHNLVKYAGGKGTDMATIGSKEVVPVGSKNIEALEVKRVEIFKPDEIQFGQGTHNTQPDNFISSRQMGNTQIPGDTFDYTGGTGGIGGTPDIEETVFTPNNVPITSFESENINYSDTTTDLNNMQELTRKEKLVSGIDNLKNRFLESKYLNPGKRVKDDKFKQTLESIQSYSTSPTITDSEKDSLKTAHANVNMRIKNLESSKGSDERMANTKLLDNAQKQKTELETKIQNRLKTSSAGSVASMKTALDYKLRKEDLALKKEALGMQKQKGDLALWETKLRAGENMLGTLIGGGKPVDFGAKVGSGGSNLARNPNALIGGGTGENSMVPYQLTGSMGANNYHMMNLLGGGQQREPFGSKVMATVGASQPKSFAQTVGETIGTKKPEELIREEQVKREALIEESVVQPQQFRQPVQQYQQPIRSAQTMQQFRQPVQQYQQPMVQQQRKVDWDNVSPQQAAQVDTSYAKYMAESQGEHVYRRGPYKKRQYR